MSHSLEPDLVPNCLQKLSVDDTSRQRVNGSRDTSTPSMHDSE